MLSKIKNKKAEGTFEGWTQTIAFSILFVILFGTIITSMNALHGGADYEIEGLDTTDLEADFQSLQESTNEKISGGEISFGDTIVTLSTSWDIIISMLKLVLSFIVLGEWVMTLISMMKLPSAVGLILRGLWIIAIFFIILRILFNRKT